MQRRPRFIFGQGQCTFFRQKIPGNEALGIKKHKRYGTGTEIERRSYGLCGARSCMSIVGPGFGSRSGRLFRQDTPTRTHKTCYPLATANHGMHGLSAARPLSVLCAFRVTCLARQVGCGQESPGTCFCFLLLSN